MFKIFENMFEPYQVTYEIYVGDELSNKQTMEAPKEILIANFIQTVKQIQNDKNPIKIKMIRQETIWDDFENKQKVLNNEIEFDNLAMVAWQNDKQNEGDI